MSSNQLADYLKDSGAIHSSLIYEAIKGIDRKEFVPKNQQHYAYSDHALEIGFGQTISQPYTVALMLECLDIKPGQKILDIGSGSGWTTALLAYLTGPTGRVFGVERVAELAIMGQENLAKFEFAWAQIVQAETGIYGLPDESPFDHILVSAEAKDIPKELVNQLASPGSMVIPVNDILIKLQKDKNRKISMNRVSDYYFVFVPLIK